MDAGQHGHDQRILAVVGEVLLGSLDRGETVERLARTLLEHMADLCVVTTVERSSGPCGDERLHVFASDPFLAAAVERAPERVPSLRSVIDMREPLLLAGKGATDGETRCDWPALDERASTWSAMHVPLSARGQVVGALTFVSTRADRAYGAADLLLAEEVGRRAALALDNARLHAAAQEAVRARDIMLGFVAHDLRDPLNAVLMHAQRTRSSLEAIYRNAAWMNRLVKDLLDVARFDGGAFRFDRDAVPVDLVLAEVVETLRSAAHEAGVELYTEGERGLPPVLADHDRLLQVLDNLVENALKFTPRGGRVTVGARCEGGAIMFSVTDSGIGIAPEHLPRVFDRFWQAQRTAGRGSGLGLAIAKSLVEALGGNIWVESTPGRGSQFSFTVPIAARQGDGAKSLCR